MPANRIESANGQPPVPEAQPISHRELHRALDLVLSANEAGDIEGYQAAFASLMTGLGLAYKPMRGKGGLVAGRAARGGGK